MALKTVSQGTSGPTKPVSPKTYSGRKMIISDASEITRDNILSELVEAMGTHRLNAEEINYLYEYKGGKQPILSRVKDVREEINNKVCENRALQITEFKVGYMVGEPIRYVSRTKDDSTSDSISLLNEWFNSESADEVDRTVFDWIETCGIGYKIVLPDKPEEADDAPFEIYALDPRTTFVIHTNDYTHKPLAGVVYTKTITELDKYLVYTPKEIFVIEGDEIISSEENPLGIIPIFEYIGSQQRMGCFEAVLPLLDALNTIQSNRVDGVEQFVQSFIKFIDCDIDEEKFAQMRTLGAIKVKSNGGNSHPDVQLMTQELNQSQTQILKDDLYQTILEICGMPNRNSGNTTGDTGAAIILRDGWSNAESYAKTQEVLYKKTEREFLKAVLKICSTMNGFALRVSQLDIKFTRRNYEAAQSKTQILCQMLQSGKIHPRIAFDSCGLFPDPENAYLLSEAYVEEQRQLAEERMLKQAENNPDDKNKGYEPPAKTE